MKPAVHLVSLGCAKNLVDAEVMLGTLLRAGHPIVAEAGGAEVVIVNTCGFIEPARKESIEAILRAGGLRGRRKVIVAGCLAQRSAKEMAAELPEASAFIGINEVPRIAEIVARVVEGLPAAANGGDPRVLVSRKPAWLYDFASPRLQATPSHFAWVKIAEGCNHPCAFCSIPIMRGRHRSRPAADIEAEARALIGGGAKELLLISQDTTWYGRDLGGSPGIADLVRRLDAIEGDFWIRLLYTHPAHWSDELIHTIAGCRKVARYVDMPLQHISDRMLERMQRETGGAYIRDLIARIRAGIPGIAVRTTFIVGFPGETEADVDELCAFVAETRFDRLGVFRYSQEDGTRAAKLDHQVPARTKEARWHRLMKLQQAIAAELGAAQVGRSLRVLVEEPGVARGEADAPDIDGRIYLPITAPVGEFAQVRITGFENYDLLALPAGVSPAVRRTARQAQ
ncbi:MAG: 30S ribosomal protein S12 methylthiotransferase RimO [Verrucomicrobiae bacterium]|nr:30S ribosomal protein S12 methylthiotransferase RimO [Verrucomicrobiae bacterium]